MSFQFVAPNLVSLLPYLVVVVMNHSMQIADQLNLGSINGVWSSREEWSRYCRFLDSMAPELPSDSEGVPIKLRRYAVFLEVCMLTSVRLWNFFDGGHPPVGPKNQRTYSIEIIVFCEHDNEIKLVKN